MAIPKEAVLKFGAAAPRGPSYQKVCFTYHKLVYTVDKQKRPTTTQKLWGNGVYGGFLGMQFISDNAAIDGSRAQVPVGDCWDKDGNLSPEIEAKNEEDCRKACWMSVQDARTKFASAGFSAQYMAENGCDYNDLIGEYTDEEGRTYPGRVAYVAWCGVPKDKPKSVKGVYGNADEFISKEEFDAYIAAGEVPVDGRTFSWRKKTDHSTNGTETEPNTATTPPRRRNIPVPKTMN